jgi:membrane-bound lytic murein transglycosylase D
VRFENKLYFRCIPLILLALSGCTSYPANLAETAGTPEATDQLAREPALQARARLLETLVRDAAQHSNQPARTIGIPDAEDEAEPVTTTIPMTPNRIVERTINNYLQNNRSVLRAWAERSQIYFPMIEQIFAEEEVPDELKYLAIGESGLNPTIRSPAGAVGMWQFMPATGRSEGLRVDSWVDERRDPELATRAAARHLKKLNQDYNGRWHLSVAGYNCSYRCISRAAERSGYSMDDPPSFWDIYTQLPKETREFVPKFIATALLVSNPLMYGIEVQDLGQELAYDIVKVQGMLSLDDAADMAGTDLPSLRKLNPSLLRNTLPADPEAYALKIPLGSYDTFVHNFMARAPEAPSGDTGDYIVKSGDTLGRIANQYKVSVAELQAANGISGHLININQKLRIPGLGGMGKVQLLSSERQFVAYGNSPTKPIPLGEEFTLVHQSGSTPEKPLLAVSLNMNAIEVDEGAMSLVPTIYRVQTGDTLGAIAQRFGVSVASIQANNRLSGTLIRANQELTIHSATNIMDPPRVEAGVLTYTVQNGDNLYVIARRFNISVDVLKRLNGLNDNLIHPGQNLQVN